MITVWVGTLWSTGLLVAPVLFELAEDRSLAGSIVGHLFFLTNYIGLACGSILIFISVMRSRKAVSRQHLFWIVIVMMLLVLASQFVVRPTLAGIRAQVAPGEIMASTLADEFALWHAVAGCLYLLLCSFGLALVAKNASCNPH